MSKLVFLKEDGQRNIFDETGHKAMDVVDEKPDPFAVKQLVNLDSYLEKKASASMDQKQTEQRKDIFKDLRSSQRNIWNIN